MSLLRRPPSLLRQVLLLLQKDLRVELRTGEVAATSVLFSAVLVSLFVFAGFSTRKAASEGAPGLLWMASAFVAVLVVTRTFEREREDGAVTALLLIPGASTALFFAKLAYNWLMLTMVQAVLLVLVGGVFAVDWFAHGYAVALALLLGGFGLCAVGTTLAALLAAMRLREVIVPVVLFPLCVPLLIAGAQASHAAIRGQSSMAWIATIGIFDLLFVGLGQWLFGLALEGAGGGEGDSE
jgi:heme exporter protein B